MVTFGHNWLLVWCYKSLLISLLFYFNFQNPNWRYSHDHSQATQVTPIPPPHNHQPKSIHQDQQIHLFNGHSQEVPNNLEREQRRKFRVEKKLQEFNDTSNEKEMTNGEESHHDMVEFANNYFNSHEKSPEGTIIATLTRKRQSSEMIPKYEMVTFYKGNTIPNSHIHLYDPDNINVACSIFRVSISVLRSISQFSLVTVYFIFLWCFQTTSLRVII